MLNMQGRFQGATMTYGVALAAALLLTGCVSGPRFTVDVPKQRALKLNDVYVYFFLDVRDDFFSKEILLRIRSQLAVALTRHGVRNTQMVFRDVRSGQGAPVLSMDESSLNVSVGVIIARNQLNEEVFGARYRLLIFPAETRFDNSECRIIWRLMDATTDEVIWSATSSSRRHSDWAYQARLVEGFIDRLLRQGLIEAMHSPARAAERPGPGQ
ncbi:hypothetical protein ACLESD_39175 [Pyxidicoccus sp. 3LFB2]